MIGCLLDIYSMDTLLGQQSIFYLSYDYFAFYVFRFSKQIQYLFFLSYTCVWWQLIFCVCNKTYSYIFVSVAISLTLHSMCSPLSQVVLLFTSIFFLPSSWFHICSKIRKFVSRFKIKTWQHTAKGTILRKWPHQIYLKDNPERQGNPFFIKTNGYRKALESQPKYQIYVIRTLADQTQSHRWIVMDRRTISYYLQVFYLRKHHQTPGWITSTPPSPI